MATVNKAFKVKNGIIAPAATTAVEPLIIPHGTAPSSPTNGSIWTTTAGIYVRINGNTVGPLGAGTGGGVTVSDTAPGSPTAGDLWYESDTGNLYVYYDSFWVQVGGAGNVSDVVTNVQTASYQLVLSDRSKVIEMNVGSANNLTVPASGTVNFPIGTTIDVVQYGSGQTTIVAAGGVTIRSANSALKLSSQYSAASLYKRGTDEWVAMGDLTV